MAAVVRRARHAFGFLLVTFSTLACSDPTLTDREQAQVIDGALARLRETYFETGDIPTIETAIRGRVAQGAYRTLTQPEAFANQLQDDFRAASKDPHFRVIYVPGDMPRLPTSMKRPPEAEADRSARVHLEAVLYNNGFARVQRLEGNVGILELTNLPDGENMVEKAAAAMTFLADTSALILDLRANGGGDLSGVDVVLSYFVEGRIHTYDMLAKKAEDNLQYFTDARVLGPRYAAEKPVFVLTSRRTFSAGEAMVDAMRTWRRARVIGERTRGGSNAALPTKATDHFIVGIPFMKTVNVATGKNWNVVGVEPDLAVSADKAQDTAYGCALEAIVSSTKIPAEREQAQALLQRLKAKPQG